MMSTADANPVDTFVIDFRGNTGGDDSIINPLLSGLEQRIAPLPNVAIVEMRHSFVPPGSRKP